MVGIQHIVCYRALSELYLRRVVALPVRQHVREVMFSGRIDVIKISLMDWMYIGMVG